MEPNTLSAETVTLCTGIEKTGKTAELIACALRLIEDGADACDLLVFAASPDTAISLRNRLAAASGSLAGIRVTAARGFALDVLSAPEVEASTGRKARMLTRFEESFLAEDLRTRGMPPKRIASMMGFFRKGLSELADCRPSWLQSHEEHDLYALLSSRLKAYGAYLEPELSGAAFHALCANRDALQRMSARHVLVDDYHLLSRASQHLACLVAQRTLFITSNPEGGCEAFDSYPHAEGAAELRECAPQACVIELGSSRLPLAQQHALSGLSELAQRAARVAAGYADETRRRTGAQAGAEDEAAQHAAATEQRVGETVCRMPEDEFTAIGAWAADLRAKGSAPDELAVVAPNSTWARNIAAALAAEGIPSESAWSAGPIGGDIRYADLSQAAQFVTLLTLAANPDDAASLRAWCGFGEYLTCRSIFAEMMDACEKEGIALCAMLTDAASCPERMAAFTYGSEAEHILGRIELLKRARADLEGRRGSDLVDALIRWTAESCNTPAVLPRPVAGLLTHVADEDDARSLAAKVRRSMDFPCLPRSGAVAIVNAERAAALDVRHTAIAGMVNGFAPAHVCFDRTKAGPRKAARMIAADARRYRAAAASGTESTELFRCASMRGTDARMHGVLVERYFIDRGMRCARLSRSIIADAMLGAPIELDS